MKPHSVRIKVGADELTINKNVIQHIRVVEEHEKARAILDVLKQFDAPDAKALIFVSQKATADMLTKALYELG